MIKNGSKFVCGEASNLLNAIGRKWPTHHATNKHGQNTVKRYATYPHKTTTQHKLNSRRDRHDPMATEIVVVLIGGAFSVLVAIIHRGQKENRQDHGRVHEALGRIEQKIDHHTENHS